MRNKLIILFCICFVTKISFGQNLYFPPANDWQTQSPTEVGINAEKLQQAVDFALANEYSGDRDLRIAILKGFAREPYHYLAGKTKSEAGLLV